MLLTLAAVLGGCFGSFFNVVAWRLPLGMSLNHPGSHCPKCLVPIPWYRNVPVVTWVIQRGRCAECSAAIPPRYVLVEAVCAALALGWCWILVKGLWPDSSVAAGWIVFAMVGIPIALIDWDTFEIPDGLVVIAGLGGLAARLLFAADPVFEIGPILRDGLLAGGFLYALAFGSRVGLGWLGAGARRILRLRLDRRRFRRIFSLVARWSRFDADVEALGFGDVSLALAAGTALGFPPVVLGLPIAAILGVAAHLLVPGDTARGKAVSAGLDSHAMPFGPFLIAGFLIASILLGVVHLQLP